MRQTTAKKILKELVAFPIFGGESNWEIINFINDYLEQYKIEFHLLPNLHGDKNSLICRFGPPIDGGVILSGHTDVVPVEGQIWETNPFKLTEKNNKLYGRGAADMKGFLACCLTFVPDLLLAKLRRPIYFAFSYDEEIGCLGTPDLLKGILEHYDEKPKYAIIGEPSMMRAIIGQKGASFFRTTVKGSTGHSSQIMEEVSAVHEAAKLIAWFEGLTEEYLSSGRVDERFAPPHTSIHVGMIRGGTSANIIAENCYFEWDIRAIPTDSIEKIISDFSLHCEKVENKLREKSSHARITTNMIFPIVPGFITSENSSVIQLATSLTKNNELKTVSYGSEASFFAEAGYETVICGPGSISQAHRANEYISISQLNEGLSFIKGLIHKFCDDLPR